MRLISCSLAFVTSLAAATLLAGDAGQGELKKIQGTWKFVSQEMAGKSRPAEDVAKLTITFDGDKWTVREGTNVVQAGTHKFDASKKPVTIDAAVTEGEGKGSTMLGIYERDGDTMKVCFDPQGKARPTSFKAGEGQFSATLKREK
jgi:uncharacterized protein (TIGR03067 family)